MFTLLFYERESDPPVEPAALGEILADLGVVWEAPTCAAYRPGRWADPATGAQLLLDLGELPLTEVDRSGDDPPTSYAGWRAVPLTVQIPLTGPHWFAVEGLTFVERFLRSGPGLVPLDAEDTRLDDQADAGPFPFDRPRAQLSWEQQRDAQSIGRVTPRLDRAMSVALWRYRRERGALRQLHREHHWPEAPVLLDRSSGEARTTCLWLDRSEPIALPPVQLVTVRIDQRMGCVPSDVIRAATGATPGPIGTTFVTADAVEAAALEPHLIPVARYAALGDQEWAD